MRSQKELRIIVIMAYFDKYIECGSLGLKLCKIIDGTANLFVKDI